MIYEELHDYKLIRHEEVIVNIGFVIGRCRIYILFSSKILSRCVPIAISYGHICCVKCFNRMIKCTGPFRCPMGKKHIIPVMYLF